VSIEARQALVDNPKLSFTDDRQRSDLLDDSLTSTYLIAMLQTLLVTCIEPIELLAIRSDHPTPDGVWEHWGGKAGDLYPKNWEGREQEACCNVMKAMADNQWCEQFGAGGVTRAWISYVTWPSPPSGNSFTFDDDNEDHLHFSCATAVNVAGGARAQGGSW
jgi:hypothetical protein